MSEFATLHVDSLVRIDPTIPLDRAALVGCGVMTGVGAVINTAGLEPGSTAVVFGAGGVGLNAIQACALAGASQIVAVDTMDEKLELAREFGATHTVNASGESNVVRTLRKLTGGGADYAFECVGSGAVVAQAYGAIRKGGTAVVVGVAPPGDTTSISTSSLTFSEKTLKGSYFGSAQPQLGTGDPVPPGARADAGLHRRAGGGRPGRHARRHGQGRRRPAEDQPVVAGGPGDRPFGNGG
jgi:S-(hydroxymethyl)glutathione dehydrogenase/alcohol dehydrogenase